MSIQLSADEMLEVLSETSHPLAASFRTQVEATASAMATAIAQVLDCNAGEATFQGVAMAGTCAPFRPRTAGQPVPPAFEHWDVGGHGDWEAEAEELGGAPTDSRGLIVEGLTAQEIADGAWVGGWSEYDQGTKAYGKIRVDYPQGPHGGKCVWRDQAVPACEHCGDDLTSNPCASCNGFNNGPN